MLKDSVPENNDNPQLTITFDAAPAEEVRDWRSKVPSVSQLTRRLRGHIESTFFDVWVKGEVTGFKKPVSGHAYFNLKDNTAQLKAVMFKGSLSKLKFQIKDGMEILLHGNIGVYEARGEYQLVADTAEPVGAGALQLAFEQLKAKLHKEGLFDPKFKKPLPKLPKRIGIVTSPTGAAVKDILKVLSRRYAERQIFILPAAVQGEKAAGEIATAMKNAELWNAQNPDKKIEVLIVGRGGGSLEDLWPFNEEVVARAAFDCTIPIISAVGHEIDYTIIDFVSDLRAPTPSAAAEVVLPRKEDLINLVLQNRSRMTTIFKKHLAQVRLHVGHLSSRIIDPRERIKIMRERFKLLEERLKRALANRLTLSKRRLEAQIQMLNSLSPLGVLARGYALAQTPDEKIIRSVAEIQIGQSVEIRLADGKMLSKVISTSPNK